VNKQNNCAKQQEKRKRKTEPTVGRQNRRRKLFPYDPKSLPHEEVRSSTANTRHDMIFENEKYNFITKRGQLTMRLSKLTLEYFVNDIKFMLYRSVVQKGLIQLLRFM